MPVSGGTTASSSSHDLLDRELPTLQNAISMDSKYQVGNFGAALTASTRSRLDLPAFCRPIMVTSISVALQGTGEQAFICGDGPGVVLPRRLDGPLTRTSSIASHRWCERSQPCWWVDGGGGRGFR